MSKSAEFVVVRENQVLHGDSSLTAAAVAASGVAGAAVFQRVEIGDGKEEMARFDQTMKEINAEAEAIRRPVEPQRTLGLHVVPVPNDNTFRPKTPDATPPGRAAGLPIGELGQFAIQLNRGSWLEQRRLWATITDNGALLLVPCKPEDRPTDPTSFPPHTRVEPRDEAKILAMDENTARLVNSHIPRTWTVALRPLTAFVE